jgi:cytosine/adenosine deaminase-related metal-dependent hydrolase
VQRGGRELAEHRQAPAGEPAEVEEAADVGSHLGDGRVLRSQPEQGVMDRLVPGAELIDVHDHIVFPGFVDGHSHLYQTVLRGLGVEWSLVEYCIGIFGTLGAQLSVQDVYLGTLLGALDSIDAGVTGVYDLAYCQVTPEPTVERHVQATVRATISTSPLAR